MFPRAHLQSPRTCWQQAAPLVGAAGGERACLSSSSPRRRPSWTPLASVNLVQGPPFLHVHLRACVDSCGVARNWFLQLSRPQPWGLRSHKPQRRARRACAHLTRPSSFHCHSQNPSRSPASSSEANQCTDRTLSRSAARHQDGSQVPVSAFVVGLRLGTTRDVRTGHDCLAVPGDGEACLSPTTARSFLLVTVGLPPTSTCATLPRSGV